jgi:predicted nucleic acid-binding protein
MEYVLDSSVIVKWFSFKEEEYIDKAAVILELYKENKIDIFIPELVIYEVSNALRYNENFSSNEVREIIKYLVNLELNTINLNSHIIDEAIKYAYDGKITVYDAIFLVISDVFKIPLVSANPKHHKIAEGRNIVLLKDF